MCGYLNLETVEKRNDVAAFVTGVKSIDYEYYFFCPKNWHKPRRL
jgi:hypothetical protein